MFRNFIFPGNKIPENKNIWFEKDKIKKDSEYYETIIKIIDIFLKYCLKEESFSLISLSEEINNIFVNSKFFEYYKKNIRNNQKP